MELKLVDMEAKLNGRIDHLEEKLEKLDGRIDNMEEKLEKLNG